LRYRCSHAHYAAADVCRASIACLMAGKHVEVGKLVADGWVDAQAALETQRRTGLTCTLSLPFNNDGPLGFFSRYIGDNATCTARYSDLEQQNKAF
jgi:hypothetical protein